MLLLRTMFAVSLFCFSIDLFASSRIEEIDSDSGEDKSVSRRGVGGIDDNSRRPKRPRGNSKEITPDSQALVSLLPTNSDGGEDELRYCKISWRDEFNLSVPGDGFSKKLLVLPSGNPYQLLRRGNEEFEVQVMGESRQAYPHRTEHLDWIEDHATHNSYELVNIYVRDGRKKVIRLQQQRLETPHPHTTEDDFIPRGSPRYISGDKTIKQRFLHRRVYKGKSGVLHYEDIATREHSLEANHKGYSHGERTSHHVLDLSLIIEDERVYCKADYVLRSIGYSHQEKTVGWDHNDDTLTSTPRIRSFFVTKGDFNVPHGEEIVVRDYMGSPKKYSLLDSGRKGFLGIIGKSPKKYLRPGCTEKTPGAIYIRRE